MVCRAALKSRHDDRPVGRGDFGVADRRVQRHQLGPSARAEGAGGGTHLAGVRVREDDQDAASARRHPALRRSVRLDPEGLVGQREVSEGGLSRRASELPRSRSAAALVYEQTHGDSLRRGPGWQRDCQGRLHRDIAHSESVQ